MSNNYNNLWKLHELPSHDARLFLDIIVANAKYNKIQAIPLLAKIFPHKK
jgi:hypothetical protein